MTFNNNAKAYTLSDSGASSVGISGAASVTLNGSGTVTFASPNTYTGATVISNGTLKLTPGAVPAPQVYFNMGYNGTTVVNSGWGVGANNGSLYGIYTAGGTATITSGVTTNAPFNGGSSINALTVVNAGNSPAYRWA